MMKELLNEQKEDLYKLALKGCSNSDVIDYCAENNVSYILAQSFMDETYRYLNKGKW